MDKTLNIQDVHEANSAVFASRDEVANKIIQNLRRYGDLSAPGSYGRGFNAGSKANGRFSSSNYLRFLANQDGRTDSSSYVSENWLQQQFPGIPNPPWLKENAVPVLMERWEEVSIENPDNSEDEIIPAEYTDGKERSEEVLNNKVAMGHLVTFYNIDDLLHITASLPNARRITNHDESYDFEYAEDLLESVGIERLPYRVRTIEEIKDVVFNYAKEQRCNDLSAAMTVHLFFRDCHLTPPVTLFTEEMIAQMEEKHSRMFSSIKTAQKITNYIHKAEDRSREKLKEEVNQIMSNKDKEELFKDFSIRFNWAEDWIYDIDGNQFMPFDNPSSEEKHSGIYKGEDAYKFLAAIARYDKEQFDRGHRMLAGYTKSNMDIMSPVLNHRDMRIDLGDLELGNKTSVIDAFEERILRFYHEHVNDPISCRYAIISNYTEDGNILGKLKISEEELAEKIAEYQKEVADEIPEIRKYFDKLRKDEAKFIEKNPAFKEYNEYKADSYKYLVKKSFLKYLEELPMNGREHGLYFNILQNYGDMPEGSLTYMDIDKIKYHESSNLCSPDSLHDFNRRDWVMVEAYESPVDIYRHLDSYQYRSAGLKNRSHVNDIKVLFSPEEVKLAHELDELKYKKEYVSTNPYRDSFDACVDVEVSGFDAICQARYDYVKNVIPKRAEVYETYRNGEEFGWHHHNFYLNPKFNGHFTIDGEEQKGCVFSEGQGQLQDKSFTDNFFNAEKQGEFDKLYAFAGKYYYEHGTGDDLASHFMTYSRQQAAKPIDADFASKVDLSLELEIHQARHPEIDITKSKLSSMEIGELANYYKQSVSLYLGDAESTLNSCNALAVKMMLEDGLSNSKINSVFTCLQDRVHTTKAEAENRMPLSDIMNSNNMKQLQKEMKQRQAESIFKTKSR